ncbi:DUF397 domain-containing protein [Streptomyces sp. NPDC005865]|uniref:DUF397 domain-containing protein n=1 Tax=Streptomyces sp. NPDC005865 TaxID=3155453 RepID=UPI0033E11791
MTEPHWQKSSFSEGAGANCVYVAVTDPAGRVHLQESDDPATTLTTAPRALAARALAALIRTLTSADPGPVTTPSARAAEVGDRNRPQPPLRSVPGR